LINEDIDEAVSTLTMLGLTSCQARILTFLAYSGASTAKIISRSTGISRPDVYRVTPKLRDLGLIKEIVNVPVKFEVVSIEDAVSILVEKKINETKTAKLNAKKMVATYKKRTYKQIIQKSDHQFVIIPKGMAIKNKRGQAIDSSKKSIDAIISYSRYLPTIIDNYDRISKALNRGVHIRHITEKPNDIKMFPKEIKDLWGHPLFDIKLVDNPLNSLVAIYDKKEVIVSILPDVKLYKSEDFWSNNLSFLEIIQSFFENTWANAQPLS
jgi:sugar-specific transcriptional regulator TrmB